MNVVLRFDPARIEDLRVRLVKEGFSIESRPNALLFATRPGVSLTAYGSGKILVTGADADAFAARLGGVEVERPAEAPTSSAFAPHAGGDESGKGDYFGPLAVACVFIPNIETANFLIAKGVRDSKLLGPGDAGPLASLIRARCSYATVVLPPERYNELYARTPNLNDLLAWAHARCIEDLRTEVGPVPVIVDQFARPDVLNRHLMAKGREVPITQVVRGESDVAVAAASILARAEFLAGIAALESRTGARLPLGAGPPVVRAARDFVARRGSAALKEVAKMHFATTRAVTGGR